jgi:UDP-N-acetylmuramate dehydrogenase
MDLNFQKNLSLRPYNTFGINVQSKQFIGAKTTEELKYILRQKKDEKILIIGGGSNLLLTRDFEGLTLRIESRGIEIIREDEESATVKVAAGENWHEFVLWCLENNLGGVENLALIPGSVGAAPIQNIGAYGSELKNVFSSCEAISISNGVMKTFSKAACQFSYRNSIFKNELKGQYVITSVNFLLYKAPHSINDSYKGLNEKMEGKNKTIQNIAHAIIAIRSEKLPNPEEIGNSGSFFKNPVIPVSQFKALQKKFTHIPHYPDSEGKIKVPAAWMIDVLGLKGFRNGDAGVHKNQPLVLVNYGNASGKAIKALAEKIQSEVAEKFGINLTAEVNII